MRIYLNALLFIILNSEIEKREYPHYFKRHSLSQFHSYYTPRPIPARNSKHPRHIEPAIPHSLSDTPDTGRALPPRIRCSFLILTELASMSLLLTTAHSMSCAQPPAVIAAATLVPLRSPYGVETLTPARRFQAQWHCFLAKPRPDDAAMLLLS